MHRFVATAVLLTGATLSGCSAKEAAKTDSLTVAQTGAASGVGSYDPTTHTVTVKAREYAFAAPDTIPAGWTTFHLVNDGTTIHHIQIVRLDSGKTPADADAALRAGGLPPKWLVELGGPNPPEPKGESRSTVNLAPGAYILLCMIDDPDRTKHFTKGMVHPLTVVASTTQSTEPTADATIALADYNFVITGAIKSGHHTIKVVNNGPQHHEVAIIRIAPGKTMKDVAAYFAKPDGPSPVSFVGGVAGVIPSVTSYLDIDFVPGNYAMFCVLPDAKDGKRHVEHGMVKEFKIE